MRALLQLLHRGEQRVVVKHTFIEVVEPEAEEAEEDGVRRRYFSDSVLNSGYDEIENLRLRKSSWRAEAASALHDHREDAAWEDHPPSPPDSELCPTQGRLFGEDPDSEGDAAGSHSATQPHESSPQHLQAQPASTMAGSAKTLLPTLLGTARAGSGGSEKVQSSGPIKPARPQLGAVPPESRTTVMLRNLPNNFSRAQLLTILDDSGLAGMYDFLYLPIDFRTGAALGYAFLNAVNPSAAKKIWESLDGFSRWSLPTRKVCSVGWSDPHQGLEENVNRYRNSPVMHPSVPDAHKPVVFKGGERTTFPAPTKALRAPRVRRHHDGRRDN